MVTVINSNYMAFKMFCRCLLFIWKIIPEKSQRWRETKMSTTTEARPNQSSELIPHLKGMYQEEPHYWSGCISAKSRSLERSQNTNPGTLMTDPYTQSGLTSTPHLATRLHLRWRLFWYLKKKHVVHLLFQLAVCFYVQRR